MSRVEEVERAVRDLSPQDLRQFREWFQRFEDELWDRQIERDAAGGRLDALAEEAMTEIREGRTGPL
jgi:hypothetical protein